MAHVNQSVAMALPWWKANAYQNVKYITVITARPQTCVRDARPATIWGAMDIVIVSAIELVV